MSQSRPTFSPWIKRGSIAVCLLAAIGAASMVATTSVSTEQPSATLTHRVSRGSLKVLVTETGTVESSNNKEIKCMVKGGSTVLSVIEPGTMVEPGDVLVRLDQSQIEDNILAQQIIYENAVANEITAESDVAVAKTSITEYLEGTYIEERSTIEKDIFDAEQALKQAELNLESSSRLAAKGLIKSLQLDRDRFAVESARKDLELKRTQLEALEKYKKVKELQTLRSNLRAAEAQLASFEASLRLEEARLDREKEQLKNCVIKADVPGMVILPSMAEWKQTPDIEEGAVVREQQTLLMIPDVEKMQVKVGIHESKVDRLRIGMPAVVELQDLSLTGTVEEIAEVTKPAGWWTGNMVKYDTIIKLPSHEGLKPGMTALVDVVLAKHNDVLTVPVATILEDDEGYCVYVKSKPGFVRRRVALGDTNDEFTIVESGLTEGDEVVLNPLAFISDSQAQSLRPAKPPGNGEAARKTTPEESRSGDGDSKKNADARGANKKKVDN